MIKEFFKACLDGTTLSQTAYENAEEKYQAIGNFLEGYFEENHHVELSIYAQGSFSTNTVVRPYRGGVDKLYDVDMIVEIDALKGKYTSSELKSMIKSALDDSIYKDKYVEWDKCFTVEYADLGGYEFSIDVVPSVPEDLETKNYLRAITEVSNSLDSAIAIPDSLSSRNENRWITNNPKGYSAWFNSKKDVFTVSRYNFMKFGNVAVYDSIDELPEITDATELQNVVKAMKRMMAVYYDKKRYSNKPASIIISTVVAKLATGGERFDEFELLKYVVEQLGLTNAYSTMSNSFKNDNAISNIILRENGNWVMYNPCNGKDNLLDGWNNDASASQNFMEWLKYLQDIVLPALSGIETPRKYQVIKEAFASTVAVPELEPPKTTLNEALHTKPYYGITS